MTPRTRIVAATLGATLLGGALVAAPATAQQRDYTNGLATHGVPTDTDVPHVSVDANRSTVQLTMHTENLGDDFDAEVYLAQRKVPDGGHGLMMRAEVRNGVVTGLYGSSMPDVTEEVNVTQLPADALAFSRRGADVTLGVRTSLLPWTGPIHVGGQLDDRAGSTRFIAESAPTGFGVFPTFLGPITTAADPTTTALSLSAPRQVFGQPRATVLTARVPAGAAGSVTFRDGATALGTVKQVGGVARLSLPRTLRAGVHTLTATFAPADRARYSTSTAATWLSVSAQPTTTAVRLSKGKQKYRGKPARLVVTISGRASGTVTVLDGRRRLKVVRVKDGRAAYTLPRTLKAGKHRITAVFRPATAGTYAGSTSNTVRLRVTR